MSIASELTQLYYEIFGSKPHVASSFFHKKEDNANSTVTRVNMTGIPLPLNKGDLTIGGSSLREHYEGVEIWLPTRLILSPRSKENIWFLPYSAISITGSSHWIKTALAERKGTVKELFSVDDYKISIKGFFIDKANRLFPIDDLLQLQRFHESGQSLYIENVLTDIFLSEGDKVVIDSFSLPEVTGGKKSMRPFAMTLESDSVFTLELA